MPTQAVRRPEDALWERIDELEAHVTAIELENLQLRRAAAAAVHDARGQLTNLSGFAQLLVQRAGGQMDETSQSYMAYMLRAVGDMRGLFDRLLDDHSEPWSRPVPLGDVLTDVCNTLRLRIGRAGGRVVVAGLPTVPGDRRQIERLFANLVGNSLKHPHPERDLTVVVSASPVAGGFEVAVTDNGTGVPPAALHRIFGLFEQGTVGAPGSGVGLSICREVAEQHGGHIRVQNRPDGGGASFIVFFPAGPGR